MIVKIPFTENFCYISISSKCLLGLFYKLLKKQEIPKPVTINFTPRNIFKWHWFLHLRTLQVKQQRTVSINFNIKVDLHGEVHARIDLSFLELYDGERAKKRKNFEKYQKV